VARVVDTASAMRLGIGFAFGSENSDAYNAAYFCAAISKKKFCALFGIDIEEDQWPSKGVAPHMITDRGPGIKGGRGADGKGTVIREATPSGQGQSKGIVESSQRRNTQLEGPTKYPISTLTPYWMAVREIRRLLAENQKADASKHVTNEMVRERVAPNPMGVYNFLDGRARTDAVSISFDEAVRKYLKKVFVTANRDGVTLLSQRYNSQAMLDNGLLERTGRSGVQRLEAFILPICVRYLWVSVDDQLIEVEAQPNLRDDESMLYQTYDDLEKLDQIRKVSAAEQRTHGIAASVEQIAEFETQPKNKWHASKTVPRLPSARSRQRQKDTRATASLLTGKIYD
jgi:hypothetical protein